MTDRGAPSGPVALGRPALPATLRAGFLVGAVGAGLPIAIAHLLHNPTASARDAALLALATTALYGGWSAATVALTGLLARAFDRRPTGRDGLAAGVALFAGVFGTGFLLHGLTYDQMPGGPPAGPWPLLAYALLVAAAVFGLAFAAARAAAPGLRLLAERRTPFLLLVALAGAIPVGWAAMRQARAEAGPPARQASPAPLPADGALASAGGVPRLALVALDGADWQVLRPLIARGDLPEFARLEAEGVSGPLATLGDSNSAVLWASIYSGQRPERHGVLDFFRIVVPGMRDGLFPVHRTYFKELADQASRLGLASFRQVSRYDVGEPLLWEIADRAGVPTGLVDGYYYSFPAPRFATAGSYAIAYGTDGFSAQLEAPGAAARARDVDLFVQPPELFREIRDLLGGEDFDWQSAVTLRLLETRATPRLLSFYTHEPDTVQHLYWKWHEPAKYFRVRPEDVAAKGDRIAERYRAFDRFLGALRLRLGPEAVIVVASDHGHSPTIFHQSYFTQHRHGPPGILLAAGGPLRRGLAVADATIYDLQPTLLHLLGLPVPRDGAATVREDWLDAAFRALHPVRTVPSYRHLPSHLDPTGGRASSGLEREEIEKLRALGYL